MQPKHIQGKGRGSRALTAFLSVLAVLLAALCAVSWMLLSDPNAGRAADRPSDAAVRKAVLAAVAGQECSLTPAEAGGFLNVVLRKDENGASEAGYQSLSVTAGADDTADVYLPVRYGGKTFGVLANVSPSFDPASERMRFTVNSVRVGRLPVPKSWALGLMERRLPKLLSREGDDLLCDASLLSVSYQNAAAQLKMTGLKMEDGVFKAGFGIELGIGG